MPHPGRQSRQLGTPLLAGPPLSINKTSPKPAGFVLCLRVPFSSKFKAKPKARPLFLCWPPYSDICAALKRENKKKPWGNWRRFPAEIHCPKHAPKTRHRGKGLDGSQRLTVPVPQFPSKHDLPKEPNGNSPEQKEQLGCLKPKAGNMGSLFKAPQPQKRWSSL